MPATFVTFTLPPLRSLPGPLSSLSPASVVPCPPQHSTPRTRGPACLCRPYRNPPSSLSREETFAKTNRNKYSVYNRDLHRFHERPLGWKWWGAALSRPAHQEMELQRVMVYPDPTMCCSTGSIRSPLPEQSVQGALFTQVFVGATSQIFIPTKSQRWDTLCPLDGDVPLEFGSCPDPRWKACAHLGRAQISSAGILAGICASAWAKVQAPPAPCPR